METHQDLALTGSEIRRLMRQHGLTIRSLAAQFNLTLKRIREVRAHGVQGFAANEWHRLITGKWMDQVSIQCETA